jgi:protease-4
MKKSDLVIIALLFIAAAVTFNSMILNSNRSVKLTRTDQIGVIPVQGVIFDSESFIRDLNKIASNRDIRAIILHINSPGGGTVASQEMYYAVKKIKEKYDFPVVSVLSTLGASGGYYLALASDSIYAMPGTMTGSIGVIMDFPEWTEAMEKIGVRMNVVKSGEYKDTGSPYREFTDQDKAYYQDLVNDVYDQFKMAVAESRHMEMSHVEKLSNGKVYSGRQALKLGLIDHIGTLQDAVDDLTHQLGLSDKPQIIRPKEEKMTLYNLIFGDIKGWIGSFVETPTVQMIFK